MKIIDLFEPKLPPVNLWCLPSASWFYRRRHSVEVVSVASRKSFSPLEVESRYRELRINH